MKKWNILTCVVIIRVIVYTYIYYLVLEWYNMIELKNGNKIMTECNKDDSNSLRGLPYPIDKCDIGYDPKIMKVLEAIMDKLAMNNNEIVFTSTPSGDKNSFFYKSYYKSD